ncbi:MAG: hypothetical protein WCG78_08795, partial [Candidatus Omnitrophota bacterium]
MTKNNLYIFLLIISLLGGTAAQAEKVALTADRQRPMDLLRPVSFNQRRDFQAEVMLERRVADTYSEAAGPLVQDVILCESTGMWRGFPQLVKDTLRDIPIRERLVLMVLVGNGLADTREHIEGAGHLVRLSLMQKQFAALPDFLQAKFLSLGAQIERALADRYMPAPKREADVIQALEHLTRSAVFYRRSAKAARSFVAQLDTYRGAPGVPDMRDKAELRALSLRENALNATAALTHYMNGHLDILVREFRLSISAGAGRSVDRAFTACARGHALLVKEWGERGCMDLADQRQLTTHLFVEIDMCADMLKRIFEVEHEWVGGIEDLAEQVGVLRKKAIDYRASVLADIRTKKNSPASGRATEDAIVRMNPQAAWTIAQMMRECVQKDQIKNFAGSLCLAVEKLQALDGYPLAEIEKCVLIRYAARKLARRAIVSCDQRAAGEASGEEVSVDTADEAIWDGLPIIQDPVKALSVALEALEAKPALLGKRDPDGFRILSLIMEASTLQGLSRAMTLEEDDPLHRQKTELTIDQYRAVDRHLGRVILLCDEAKDLIKAHGGKVTDSVSKNT